MAMFMQKVKHEMKKKGTEGVFSAAAKRHGMSTHAYAVQKEHSPGKVGKRARLALVFEHARNKK